MKKLSILILLCIGVFTSCNEHQTRYKTISKKTVKVKRDKVKNPETNDEIYFYFIGDNGGSSSSGTYYYSSSTPISDFKNISWISGRPANYNLKQVEEEETEEVELSDLEASIQTEIETENPSEISETTETVTESDPGETSNESSSGDSDDGSDDGDGGGD